MVNFVKKRYLKLKHLLSFATSKQLNILDYILHTLYFHNLFIQYSNVVVDILMACFGFWNMYTCHKVFAKI